MDNKCSHHAHEDLWSSGWLALEGDNNTTEVVPGSINEPLGKPYTIQRGEWVDECLNCGLIRLVQYWRYFNYRDPPDDGISVIHYYTDGVEVSDLSHDFEVVESDEELEVPF